MNYESVIPGLRVSSIAEALSLWKALGFELAFAFAHGDLLPAADLTGATFARVDAPSRNPVSVFLDTEQGARGSTIHLMLARPQNVDEAAGRLESLGLGLDQPPTDQPWGMRDLRVRDADGNVLVVGAATARRDR